MTIDELMTESYSTACSKGWWESPREIPELLMLTVSEVSEALEEYRDEGPAMLQEIAHRASDGKPEGVAAELADVLIRIGDFCQHYKIPLEAALREKLAFNKSRPYRHGGKVC